MTPRPFSSASILSSVVLAAITLLVFYMLQDYGPESALRKFHEAIVQRDAQTLNEVTMGGTQSQDVREAVSAIGSFLIQSGARYRLLRTDHRGRQVGAEVVYIFPSGQTRTIYWIIVKSGNSWKVDPTATNRVMSMPPGAASGIVGFNSPR